MKAARNAARVRAGAKNFIELMKWIHAETESQLEDVVELDGDARDYRSFVRRAEASITENVLIADPSTREGYLRALVDLLCMNADGLPLDEWDPIEVTASAFAAPALAEKLLSRIAR